MWDVCLCLGCSSVCGVGGGGLGSGSVGWYYVFVCCEFELFCVDDRSRYMYIVLGGYLRT